jgi:hypothetical protein
LVALILVAWFAVLVRNEHTGHQASDRIFDQPDMSRSDWARSLDQLRQAKLLDPGWKWTVARASALLLRDTREALRVAGPVVDDEPDNLEAWVVVLRAARGLDARRAAQARAQIRRLNPRPGGG